MPDAEAMDTLCESRGEGGGKGGGRTVASSTTVLGRHFSPHIPSILKLSLMAFDKGGREGEGEGGRGKKTSVPLFQPRWSSFLLLLLLSHLPTSTVEPAKHFFF